MGSESVLVGDVADLSEEAVLVFVAVTSFHFVRVVALLMLPLLVALVVNNLVAVFVRLEFVVLLLVVMLKRGH